MAIGKQGAYATVEGGVVDFGKITTEAIDKYQTQQALQQKLKQERAAEAAKLKEARIKDIKPFGDVSLTGNKDLDDVAHQSVLVLRKVYDDNFEAVANGDLTAKRNLNQALSELDKLAEVPKALNTRNEDYTKNSKNYNLNYLSEAVDLGKSLGHGKAVPKSDGHGGLVYDLYPTDDNGNVTSNEPIKKDVPTLQLIQGERIPAHYSADDTVADFKKNNQQALIEWYNSSNTMKTGVKDLTPTLKYNIASTALAASKSDDAMAQLMIDAGFGKKSSGYTEQDRENVKKYYETYLTNTFQKEVSQDHKFAPQPSGGDGSGGKKPLPMTPSTLYVLKPQVIELTNGGTIKVKANELIGYPASNTTYGKDETGTKQVVTLLKNKRTKELFIKSISSTTISDDEAIKAGQVSIKKGETGKSERTVYAGSRTAADDFIRLAEGYIGVTYTGKDGQKHTVESASIQELNKFIEARDSQVGIKNKPTTPTKTTTKTTTKKVYAGIDPGTGTAIYK